MWVEHDRFLKMRVVESNRYTVIGVLDLVKGRSIFFLFVNLLFADNIYAFGRASGGCKMLQQCIVVSVDELEFLLVCSVERDPGVVEVSVFK